VIVANLSTAWGITIHNDVPRTCVWFRLATPPLLADERDELDVDRGSGTSEA
jgi:hypothetical protein